MPEITKNDELAKKIVGKRIVEASMDDADGVRIDSSKRPYENWNYQGGNIKLVFDDGCILETVCNGYDSWSNDIYIDKI